MGAVGMCAADGATIEVFADDGDQGETYIGVAECFSGGWVFPVPLPLGRNVTATQTVAADTSGFSIPRLVR